jgi:hypothetical protein
LEVKNCVSGFIHKAADKEIPTSEKRVIEDGLIIDDGDWAIGRGSLLIVSSRGRGWGMEVTRDNHGFGANGRRTKSGGCEGGNFVAQFIMAM